MILSLAIALLLRQDAPHHAASGVDTVRYNREEYGLKLHVPAGWKGNPAILFPGPKDSIRVASMEGLDGTSFRGMIKSGSEIKYAFWLGPGKFKAGMTGSVLDRSGVHNTASPDWFVQSPSDYPERKPPIWPGLGNVFYALDTDRFGEGTSDDVGALSLTKHIDYVLGLGVTGVWFTSTPSDLGDSIENAKRADLKVVVESNASVKGADGIAATVPPDTKLWRVAFAPNDAHMIIATGTADTAQDQRWAELVYRFVQHDSMVPSMFDAAVRHFHEDYPQAAADQLILRLGGPGKSHPSGVLKGDKSRLLQLWTLLFSLPGIPVFDAGDEIGLFDADSKMLWDPTRQDTTLLDTVKKLILARTSRKSLSRGEFSTLLVDDSAHVYSFERQDRFEFTVAIFNNGDDPQDARIPSAQFGSAQFHDLIGNAFVGSSGASILVHLAAHSCVLLGN